MRMGFKMPEDMIDFVCSVTYLNYFHEIGATPRFFSEPNRKTYEEWQADLKRIKHERDHIRLSDEEFFSDVMNQQSLKRIVDKKSEEIVRLRQEITSLRSEIGTSMVEFKGMKDD